MLEPLKGDLKQPLAKNQLEEVFPCLKEELPDHHASCV